MAVTSRERRGRLEDAFILSAGAQVPSSLRAALRSAEASCRTAINGGSVKLVIGNGHRVEFFDNGPGKITQVELVELYRTLVDDFDSAFNFLSQCARYGLDPFVTEFQAFPNAVTVAGSALVIDTTGRFSMLCSQFGITEADIIGAALNDKSIFLWMMYHEQPVLEEHSDYGSLRVTGGAQFT